MWFPKVLDMPGGLSSTRVELVIVPLHTLSILPSVWHAQRMLCMKRTRSAACIWYDDQALYKKLCSVIVPSTSIEPKKSL